MPVFFFIFISLASIIIVLLTHSSASISIDDLARNLVQRISQRTLENTVNLLDSAASMARLNEVMLRPDPDGAMPLERFDRLTRRQMELYPQAALVYFGDEAGNHWLNKRGADGAINTRVIQRLRDDEAARAAVNQALEISPDDEAGKQQRAALISPILTTTWRYHDRQGRDLRSEEDPYFVYDPRLRPWYKGAKESGGLSWTDVYVWSGSPLHGRDFQVGVTVSVPIREGERVAGVAAIDIVLQDISSFLRKLVIGQSGRAFIVNGKGETIGLPDYNEVMRPKTDAAGGMELNHISQVSHPAMREAWRILRTMLHLKEGEPVALDEEKLFTFDSTDGAYYGFFKSFSLGKEREWIIGIVAPQDDFLGEVKRNLLLSALISLISVAVVVWISIRISRRITLPLQALAAEAERIRYLDLRPSPAQQSVFQEIDQVSTSFSNMKTSLRSFEKYVPTDLVRQLIRSGHEAVLGGERRPLSIFFSDLAGFTTLSESLPPEQLVAILGEYLGEMSDLITRHNGTVDKYIGDAIMAFWNAPNSDSDHALHACLAALDNQKTLAALREKWIAQGVPPLHCRIGINSGDVVVGNFGSAQRLNYTCMGDPVNLASRLEGVCKMYGVEIVISQRTFELALQGIEARRLDYVAVKGKTEGVFIYELMARRGGLSEEMKLFCAAYDRAFSLYLGERWEEAAHLFDEAVQLKGSPDAASTKLAARCRDYAAGRLPPSIVYSLMEK
ncbi:MAG: hypothetical protein HQL51_02965 [Magnetococcales bacterium]|nr:hypothetical protein [Magnetococcales bacterium]